MKTYHYETNSNAAPFFSDMAAGFIEAENADEAIRKVVKNYRHPSGLFSAHVETCEPEPKTVAKYLSARAATQVSAPTGVYQWKDGTLFVDDKEIAALDEKFECFED